MGPVMHAGRWEQHSATKGQQGACHLLSTGPGPPPAACPLGLPGSLAPSPHTHPQAAACLGRVCRLKRPLRLSNLSGDAVALWRRGQLGARKGEQARPAAAGISARVFGTASRRCQEGSARRRLIRSYFQLQCNLKWNVGGAQGSSHTGSSAADGRGAALPHALLRSLERSSVSPWLLQQEREATGCLQGCTGCPQLS